MSFNLDDHHLLLHPSGTNFNGGFTIRDLSAGDSVLLSGPSLGDAGVKNISHAQFFKAEKLADNTYILYDYDHPETLESRQYWPIFATVVGASGGLLYNNYGY